MGGTKYIYITRECKVYSVPIPKQYTYKAVPELTNENVLMVNFNYDTKNRKPWELFYFVFMRIQLEFEALKLFLSDLFTQGNVLS